jgi:hypothetical protein
VDVRALLKLSSGIDWLNEQFGVVANWLVLLACLISAGNAASRYLFSESSNGWLEVQWYMFAGMVLLGGPYALKMNEHGRIQAVVATSFLLVDRRSSSSASAGVLHSSVLRGLVLRAAATAATSSALCTLKSVPFGKY